MRNWKTVSVIGMGYIGLPTCAILASRGISVVGVDTNQHVVDCVTRGVVHFVEPDLDGLIQKVVSSGMLSATKFAQQADAFIVAVPTPLTEDLEPDVSYVMAATEQLAPLLKTGDLIVLESTSPIGTTRQMSKRLAGLRPDLKFPDGTSEDTDVFVAYSPERVLPGRVLTELVQNDRCVGGLSKQSSQMAAELYATFVEGDLMITSAETAELVKLTENAFRDVNIAFANELSAICRKHSLNVWETIELANRHPRVSILQPGPGVGGHCIAVDPHFIVHSAPDEAKLIAAARSINSARPGEVVKEVQDAAATIADPVIACLGLAFKPNIDDLRESPAMEIVEQLADSGCGRIIACEPHLNSTPSDLTARGVEMMDALGAIDLADIVVLLVDHRQFSMINPAALGEKKVIDTRGLWTRSTAQLHALV